MPAAPTYVPAAPSLVEDPASPILGFSDKITRTRIYRGKYADCVAAAKYQGTAGTGDDAGYVVTKSTVLKERGEAGRLTIEWEASEIGGTTPLPPDEVAVAPGNSSPRIELHSFFASLANNTVEVSGETYAEFAAARNAAAASTAAERKKWFDPLSALGQSLVAKMERGNETFYLASLRYSWVTHYWTAPVIFRGGYLEDPGGPLSGYFVSDLSWLREGDDLQFANGIWRLTRTWLGAPAGHWDSDLYG